MGVLNHSGSLLNGCPESLLMGVLDHSFLDHLDHSWYAGRVVLLRILWNYRNSTAIWYHVFRLEMAVG